MDELKIFLCYECKNKTPCECRLPEPVICEKYPDRCLFSGMEEKAEWIEAKEI